MSGYTVIDLETTGFSPKKHHRVIELGVVHVSPTGQIEDEWSTLINPGRDISNSHVHGITASHVVGAPTFAEVAPRLLPELVGRTVVAHNFSFDQQFLEAELERAGHRLPGRIEGLCTMHWSSVFLDARSAKLADCCAACSIDLSDAHSAGGDAHATAELLGHYLRLLEGSELPWQFLLDANVTYRWPSTWVNPASVRLLQRQEVETRSPDAWLDRILSRVPRPASDRLDSYTETLQRAMLDNVLAAHEQDELIALAADLGISRGLALDLHATYLWAMAEEAMADGVVTHEELAQLTNAAAVLGLGPADVDQALEDANTARNNTAVDAPDAHTAATPPPTTHSTPAPATGTASRRRAASTTPVTRTGPSTRRPSHREDTAGSRLELAGICLAPGDRIVFTGAMKRQRADWEKDTVDRGLVPGQNVTRKTKLIVAADPNSASGKAAKARAYGIPIITEEAWERLVEMLP